MLPKKTSNKPAWFSFAPFSAGAADRYSNNTDGFSLGNPSEDHQLPARKEGVFGKSGAVPLSLLALSLAVTLVVPPLAGQDSGPELISRTGGGSTWSDLGELQKAAAGGNVKAQAALGEMYVNGEQVQKDVNKGIGLLDQAAQKGNANAAFRLGKVYDDGEVAPKDYQKAIGYYKTAAKGGSATAQYNLGVIYAGAHGVKRDFVEGLAWLILGTKNGAEGDGEKQVRARLEATKQSNLIALAEQRAAELAKEIHPDTSGAPANDAKGAKRKGGASAGDPSPNVHLKPATVLPSTDSTGPKPAPDSGAAAGAADGSDRPVRFGAPSGALMEWPNFAALERDARLNSPAATYALGHVLLEGKLAPSDQAKGTELLEQAAKAGNADAAYELAEAYARGANGVPRNDEKSFAFNLQAAKAGIPFAMFNVGALYANGRGTTRDYGEALTWLILAKKSGIDRGVEDRIRSYLQSNDPAKVTAAEKRAEEIEKGLKKNSG